MESGPIVQDFASSGLTLDPTNFSDPSDWTENAGDSSGW